MKDISTCRLKFFISRLKIPISVDPSALRTPISFVLCKGFER